MRCSILLVCILLLSGAVTADTFLVVSSNIEQVELFREFEPQARLKLPEGASVELASTTDGTRFSLTGPGLFVLEESGWRAQRGAQPTASHPRRAADGKEVTPVTGNLGGTLIRAQEELGFTVFGGQDELEPTLSWTSDEEQVGYTVRVLPRGTKEVVWQRQTTDKQLTLVGLKPGAYTVLLVADPGYGESFQTEVATTIVILSPAQLETLHRYRELLRAEELEVPVLVSIASFFRTHLFVPEARQAAGKLAGLTDNPGVKELIEELRVIPAP